MVLGAQNPPDSIRPAASFSNMLPTLLREAPKDGFWKILGGVLGGFRKFLVPIFGTFRHFFFSTNIEFYCILAVNMGPNASEWLRESIRISLPSWKRLGFDFGRILGSQM